MKGNILKTKILKIFFAIILILFISTPFFILNYLIPNNIKFTVGKKNTIQYAIPLKANIISEKQGVVKINNKSVGENFNINISKPFSIQFNELGNFNVQLKLFGLIPIKKVEVNVIKECKLIPCGQTIGVEMQTNGILVLGTGTVQGIDGKVYMPSKGKLYTGDLVLKANGETLNCKEDFIKTIKLNKDKRINLKISRNNEILNVNIQPIKSIQDGNYKVGIWVRDSTQGIGTITYINPETKSYGALGHGITDIDTREIISLKDGKITNAKILAVKKGEKGQPGEIEGTILDDGDDILGTIKLNVREGIFGKIVDEKSKLLKLKSIPIALQQEVQEGEAYILSNIEGNKIEKYKVMIHKVTNFSNSMSKGLIIEIVDKNLLQKTNGIIQGMSGSPIIQNGKLIGAVTHVFVQNPSKGYGIFIENMIKSEKKF